MRTQHNDRFEHSKIKNNFSLRQREVISKNHNLAVAI